MMMSFLELSLRAQVQRDFRRPEGVAEGDMDANGDASVMAVLDLRTDDVLRDAGLARELLNRVQKLRKKAGLQVRPVLICPCSKLPGLPCCSLLALRLHSALIGIL